MVYKFSFYIFQEESWYFIYEGNFHQICFGRTLVKITFIYQNLSFVLEDIEWKFLNEYNFWGIWSTNQKFYFQGCHIYACLTKLKLNGNPDLKRNIRFFIFEVKKLEIRNLFFRVPKICMSGLPYLRRGWLTFSNMHIKSKDFSCPLICHYRILLKQKTV